MKRRNLALWGAALMLAPLPAYAQNAQPATVFEQQIADAKGAMVGEPEKALAYARRAGRSITGGDAKARALSLAEAQWLEGEALTRVNRPDEARPIVAQALATTRKLASTSKLAGDLLMSAAAIDWTTGRVKEALAGFQDAHGLYAKLGETRGQAKALQYIGTIYFDARDYPRMLRYYRQAGEIYKDDPSLTISALNNQGDAMKEMRRFPEAIGLYQGALAIARELDSPTLEVRILTNIASAQYLSGKPVAADATANRGLARAAREETGWEPFLWGVKAQAAFARNDSDLAQRYVDRTFAGQKIDATTVQFRDFHETAYKLYRKLGDDSQALVHLAAFKRLDDEARDVTASTNSALLGARFDFANQELSIVNLKAGQLQRDVQLERSRARLQQITLYGLLAALAVALAVVAGSLWALVSIRRSRNEVRHANASLSVTNAALEKALKARTEFLATTSHEIRTPLNGILGMTQVLLADRTLDRAVKDRIEVVHGAGETMRALVDDLLDVAKMETGEAIAIDEDVQPALVLRDAVRLWSDQAIAKGLSVDLDIGADVPRAIRSDGGRLRQIIFNLMSNAVKFTPEGAVTLAVSVEAVGDGEFFVVRVVDTGIGIPADRHEDIFEPFKQVDGGTSRQYGGTGLGLAICRSLSTMLGGGVTVESQVDEGSTFTLRLPLRRVAERTGAVCLSLDAARVVLVDPNPLAQGVLRAVLTPVVGSFDVCAELDALDRCLEAEPADIVLIEAGAIDSAGAFEEIVLPYVRDVIGQGARVAILFKPSSALSEADVVKAGALPIAKPLAAATLIQALSGLMAAAHTPQSAAA